MILVCNLHVNAGILHYFFPILWVTSQYYFVLQSLHKALPNTTLYYKVCTKYFPILLCIIKLAQSTSQYYFVLQNLHKALPNITLYYKTCTKHFPILLCITKLAQSTFQYYFVLQNLHELLPNTILYYKVCTKQVPVLFCTTKLAQSTSQYYFVFPKGAPHSKLLFKAAPPQSCSEQLLSLPRKVVSESGFPKLLSKVIPQSYRFSKQMSVNVAFKVAKLLPAVAPQSCSSKLLPKAASEKQAPKNPMLLPEAASKLKLVRKVIQSYSPKLLPKAVPRRCSPKLCPKAVLQSCCPKAAILQTCSPKRLPKAILQSGS